MAVQSPEAVAVNTEQKNSSDPAVVVATNKPAKTA